MIAFLKDLFAFRSQRRRIRSLESSLESARTERDNWRKQYKVLNKQYENLSNTKEYERSISGALSREVYNAKVLKQMDNTIITSADTPSSTAFKMGVQHALRVMEREVVL